MYSDAITAIREIMASYPGINSITVTPKHIALTTSNGKNHHRLYFDNAEELLIFLDHET